MADKVFTPKAILSYPTLYKPEAFKEGEKPAYSASLVFTVEAQKDPKFKAMKQAAYDAAVEMWGDKAKEILQNSKNPTFRTDSEEKGYPEGSMFINVRSYKKPGIVSVVPDPNNDGKPMKITEEMASTMGSPFEMYPGAVVVASCNAVAYNHKGNKGVSFWLNNMQKVGDGDRLAGGMPADDEFDADEEAAANLQDLTDEEVDETEEEMAAAAGQPEDDDEEPEPEPKPKTKKGAKKGAKKSGKKDAKKAVDLDDLFS
jgi:hypothetical protein